MGSGGHVRGGRERLALGQARLSPLLLKHREAEHGHGRMGGGGGCAGVTGVGRRVVNLFTHATAKVPHREADGPLIGKSQIPLVIF